METEKLEEKIENNPGITFTELKEEFDLANGQLQYHLSHSDTFQRDKGYVTRKACQKCRFSGECNKKCKKNVLRDDRKAEILDKLDKGLEKKEVAEDLGVTPSTLSYHINKLKAADLL